MSYETKWGSRIFVDIMANQITPAQIRFICRMMANNKDPRHDDAHQLLTVLDKLEPQCSPEHAKAGVDWMRANTLRKDGTYRNTPAGRVAEQSDVGLTPLLLDSITSVHLWTIGQIEAYDGRWIDDYHPIYLAKAGEERVFTFGTRPWQSVAGFHLSSQVHPWSER